MKVGLVLSGVLGPLVSTQISLANTNAGTDSPSQSLPRMDEPWRCGDHGETLSASPTRETREGRGFRLYYGGILSGKTETCGTDPIKIGGIVATPSVSFVSYKEEKGKRTGISYDLVYEMNEGVSVEGAEYVDRYNQEGLLRGELQLVLRVSDKEKLKELGKTMNWEGAPPGFEKGQVSSIEGDTVHVAYPIRKDFPVWGDRRIENTNPVSDESLTRTGKGKDSTTETPPGGITGTQEQPPSDRDRTP